MTRAHSQLFDLARRFAAWAETFPPDLAADIAEMTRTVPPEIRPFDGAEVRRVQAAYAMLADGYNLAAGVAAYRDAMRKGTEP